MPTIRFPNVMKFYIDNQAELHIPAGTVGEMIRIIVEQYPSVKFHLVDSDGNLRKHFNIFINGTHIRDLDGTETSLNEDDKVILMASAAGGSEAISKFDGIATGRRTLPSQRHYIIINLTIQVRTVK